MAVNYKIRNYPPDMAGAECMTGRVPEWLLAPERSKDRREDSDDYADQENVWRLLFGFGLGFHIAMIRSSGNECSAIRFWWVAPNR